jgi:hypothetical protein
MEKSIIFKLFTRNNDMKMTQLKWIYEDAEKIQQVMKAAQHQNLDGAVALIAVQHRL